MDNGGVSAGFCSERAAAHLLAEWRTGSTPRASAVTRGARLGQGLAATSTFLLVTVAQIWALLVQATPKRNSLSRLLAFLHIYVGLIIMPVLNDVIPAPGMEALSMPYLPGSVINTCWGMLEGFEPGSQLLGAVAVVPSYAALQLHREWRAWSAQPGPGEGQVDHPTNPGLSWTLARYLQLLLLYAVVNVIAVVALNMQALQAGPSRQTVATASSYSLPPLPTPYSDAPHSAGSSSAGSWACRLCSRLDAWDAAVGATLGRLLAWCDPDLCLVAVCGPVAALSWFAAAHALLCGKQPCTVHAMTASAGITAALMLSGVDRNKLVRSASQARQLLDDLLPSHIVTKLLESDSHGPDSPPTVPPRSSDPGSCTSSFRPLSSSLLTLASLTMSASGTPDNDVLGAVPGSSWLTGTTQATDIMHITALPAAVEADFPAAPATNEQEEDDDDTEQDSGQQLGLGSTGARYGLDVFDMAGSQHGRQYPERSSNPCKRTSLLGNKPNRWQEQTSRRGRLSSSGTAPRQAEGLLKRCGSLMGSSLNPQYAVPGLVRKAQQGDEGEAGWSAGLRGWCWDGKRTSDSAASSSPLRPQPPTLPRSMATWHPSVSVLFADIVGFSTVSQEVEPEQVFTML
ncbi:hypothetical protein QJQ45_008701 [Haematococcus lacustris]|nr:hypothetical protein QJQ45_008701 [Haematococcus lacustris]